MAGSLQQLQTRITAAKQELYGLDDAVKKVGGGGLFGGGKLDGMLQVFGGNLMTKGAMMVANFASEMGQMVTQGIELAKAGEGVRIAFERLGRGDILDGLRESTHGTVTDLELMKAAVKFNDFKLPVEELGTMLAFAQQKAKDTGQSVDYMVDSIVTGLGRKSLMILDNLGLSAAEIKEKMAQTGDMTKAVGEIIREQMAKAGEYVETAADKATQADVRLKNAMTDLGNALTPLTSSFNSFWTEIKIGGLNFMREVLAPMLNQLTEAGRIANAMNAAGGSNKVGGQLAFLSGADDKQSAYTSQLSRYNSEIQRLKINLQEIQGLPLPTDVNIRNSRLNSIGQLQDQIKAIEQLRAAYMKGAESILNPVAAVTGGTGGGGAGGGKSGKLTDKETYIPAIGSIDEMTAKVKDLQDALNQTGDQTVRGILLVQLQRANEELERMKGNGMELLGRGSGGSLVEQLGFSSYDYDKKNIKLQSASVQSNRREESAGQILQKSMSNFDKMTGGINGILSGVEQLGVEIPEGLQQMMSGIQGLMSIVQGITSILLVIEALNKAQTASSFLPFFAGGGVVRAANGFEVPGNHFSGDMVPALLNSGETVLNRSQVGVLGSALQQQAENNKQVLIAKTKGTDFIVMLDRAGKVSGKGELMFWKG
jgi:hypothetical protein